MFNIRNIITVSFALLLSVDFYAQNNRLILKQPGTLSVCSYSEFEPISYGNGQGYEADLLRKIAKKWSVKIKFTPSRTFEGLWLLPSNKNSICDVAIGGLTPSVERIKNGASFSNITRTFAQSLLVRKNDYETGKIVSYDSFKNTKFKIGVVPGTTGEKYAYLRAKEAKLPVSVIVQYKSEKELLPELINGNIAAIARGEVGNKYQQLQYPALLTIAYQNFNEGFAIAVDRNNSVLLNLLNQAIHDLKER